MDDIDSTGVESPSDLFTPGAEAQSNQDALDSLTVYMNSVPYDCETKEEMGAKLEHILSRIVVAAKSSEWRALSTWYGMLQSWMSMKYPLDKAMRIRLVKLCYELILMPAADPSLVRSWADMLQRLVGEKSGDRRKLEASDLELQWLPLWRVLQRELWAKKRNISSSRNMVNLFLYVAERCRRYYPASEIPSMLDCFVPLFNRETMTPILSVIISFLPPTHCHLYFPLLFKLWEATNSYVIDDRMIELFAGLAEEHVAGKAGRAGTEGGAAWQDVGIFSQAQWTVLVGKCLGSFHVPVASMKGPSNTGVFADAQANRISVRLKKTTNRLQSLATLFVYSTSVDGPERVENSTQQGTFLSGSKSLDALDRLIMSTESFFHPSNSGPWTLSLTTFVRYVASAFLKRWKEQESPNCLVPVTQRLTPHIKRSLVTMLRTPCLLAMFSKDIISAALAQMALKTLAMLESALIMPQILERGVGGLEVVNETHRTTAVLSTLAMVSLPLVREQIWFGGQKHLFSLLELSLPGIDMNDPHKTMVTALFISSVASQLKLGIAATSPNEEDQVQFGANGSALLEDAPRMSREEEVQLVNDLSHQFEEWVAAFFRQVFRLYENLPEEGGKSNKAGGKTEDSMLSAVKTALDMVCQHASDEIFEMVLRQTHQYTISNAKANAVRAFGQLVSSLARVNPKKTLATFLPLCYSRLEEELTHGASSIRTTSVNLANPSDTVFHWYLTILRSCLGYGGSQVLTYKDQLFKLFELLTEHSKNERGYSGVGRAIMRLLHNVAGLYTTEERFVNDDTWESLEFSSGHPSYWGMLYDAQSVKVNWHVPSNEEIDFVLEFIKLGDTWLDKLDVLLLSLKDWDGSARNDFCRFLHFTRSIWNSLPTFIKLPSLSVPRESLETDVDVPELLFPQLEVNAGFTLTDPADPRYQAVLAYRSRFGDFIHRAAVALRRTDAEDHIDAVIQICKSIDIHLLEYAITRSTYGATAKAYQARRDGHRLWTKQKQFPRSVFVKRAQYYHQGRLYLHSLYRGRSAVDDLLIQDLVEMSLSTYTRIRKYGQSVLSNVCSSFARSTRSCLPPLLNALLPGTDPDRMKGALYTLGSKSIVSYIMADGVYIGRCLLALLGCSHQDKSSIQDLVKAMVGDCVSTLGEEALSPDCAPLSRDIFEEVLHDITTSLSAGMVDDDLVCRSQAGSKVKSEKKESRYDSTVADIVSLAQKSDTHWKYVQYAVRLLLSMLRRDKVPSVSMVELFMEGICSPEASTRSCSQRAITLILSNIKMRTFSGDSKEQLWLEEYRNPLIIDISIPSSHSLADISQLLFPSVMDAEDGRPFIDKVPTKSLVWNTKIRAYTAAPQDKLPFVWERASQSVVDAIQKHYASNTWLQKLSGLWSQESNRANSNADIRTENFNLVRVIVKTLGDKHMDEALQLIEPLCIDPDRFKQRAGVEILLGYTRGSKHWPLNTKRRLWDWVLLRLPKFFALVKPDTRNLWESFFCFQMLDWDPRRLAPLMRWILSLSLDFKGDSAFTMGKTLSLYNTTADILGARFEALGGDHINVLFENVDNDFAEVREQVAHGIDVLLRIQGQPSYRTVEDLLKACDTDLDPIHIRKALYVSRIEDFASKLPALRVERLPAPRVTQSPYDRTGMTLLQWLWNTAYGPHAPSIFPYVLPLIPELFHMSECNDDAELVKYSFAVLYVLSSITPPSDYIEPVSASILNVIKTSASWRVRQNALPVLLVFLYRNLAAFSETMIRDVVNSLIDCLSDENVEVRSTAAKVFAGVLRCSQRSQIPLLRKRFCEQEQRAVLPKRSEAGYNQALINLHSAVLGLCALMDCFPYVVESWMPPLMEVFARHSTDPPPISSTIRAMASDFKKTHQDTWHTDIQAFSEDELQALQHVLVGTSYYA